MYVTRLERLKLSYITTKIRRYQKLSKLVVFIVRWCGILFCFALFICPHTVMHLTLIRHRHRHRHRHRRRRSPSPRTSCLFRCATYNGMYTVSSVLVLFVIIVVFLSFFVPIKRITVYCKHFIELICYNCSMRLDLTFFAFSAVL
jgi:hypothetical protein